MKLEPRGGGEYLDTEQSSTALSDTMVAITNGGLGRRIVKKDKVSLVVPPLGLGAAAILSGAMMEEVGGEDTQPQV